MKKPHEFTATQKEFKVELDRPCVISGYTEDGKWASYYQAIPVKQGDVFQAAPGGVYLNNGYIPRKARPLRKMSWKISWVATRLRMAVFQERDRIWNRRTRKPTNRFGKPYWVACDLRSYHIGCGDSIQQAVKRLIEQCQATNLGAEEEMAQGNRVIRWRCLLPAAEVREMEEKAKKTGFILDGVEVPPLPVAWQKGLEKMRLKHKKAQ